MLFCFLAETKNKTKTHTFPRIKRITESKIKCIGIK